MIPSQKTLVELFHEDNIDGVLFHQDSVVLKGPRPDVSFVGSLFLVQKRPVGAKRTMGVALPQPHYVIWMPYSLLYCLASHLLTASARKIIDVELDLAHLALATAVLKGYADESTASGAGGIPERADWQHVICMPVSQLHRITRKSNLRGRRIISLFRAETTGEEPALIFENSGMSKFFDELKKIAAVRQSPSAMDELIVSDEVITASYVAPEAPEPPVHTGASKMAPQGGGSAVVVRTVIDTTATSSTTTRNRSNSNSDVGSSVANNSLGSDAAYEYVDPVSLREQLYSGAGFAGGHAEKASKAAAPATKKRGVVGTMLSLGAHFTRNTSKAVTALIDDPFGDMPSGSGGAGHGPALRVRRGSGAGALSPDYQSHSSVPDSPRAGGDFELIEKDDAQQSDQHPSQSRSMHREPPAPVLTMPAIMRKIAPPLGRVDWRGAFDPDATSATVTPSSFETLPPPPPLLASSSPSSPQSPQGQPSRSARDLAIEYGGDGTLRDDDTFRKLRVKAYNGAIAEDVRGQAWSYLLGIFPVGSTVGERTEIVQRLQREYSILKYQWQSIFPEQEARHARFREHKIAIDKDVIRTDRANPEFAEEGSLKLTSLRNILLAYAMFDMDLGYCQGMSDVCAVLLLVFHDEAMAFAAFKLLLTKRQLECNFRIDVKRSMEKHLKDVEALTKRFAPELYAHLQHEGAESMIFTFRWLLILFKREFEIASLMRLWDVIFACPHTANFEIFVAAAILKNVGAQIVEHALQYDDILKFANNIAGQFDVNDILMLSHDYYQTAAQAAIQARRSGAGGGGSGLRAGEQLSVRPSLVEILSILEQNGEVPPSPTSVPLFY